MKRTKVIFPSMRGLNSGPIFRDDYISFTETTACMVNLFALIYVHYDIQIYTYAQTQRVGRNSVQNECDYFFFSNLTFLDQ